MWAVLYVRASSREGIRAETLQSGAEGTHHTGPWGKSVPGRGPSGDRALHMGGVRLVCVSKDPSMAGVWQAAARIKRKSER